MAKYSKADIEKAKDLLRAGKPVREVVKLTGMPQASIRYYEGQIKLEKKKANTAKPQAPEKDLPKPKAVTPDEVAQAKPVVKPLREKEVVGAGKLKANAEVAKSLPEVIEALKAECAKKVTTLSKEVESYKAELKSAQETVLAQQEEDAKRKQIIEKQGEHIVELKTQVNNLTDQAETDLKKLTNVNKKVKELMVREQDAINEKDKFEVKVGKLERLIKKQFKELDEVNEAVEVANQCVTVRDETIAKLQAEIEELKKQPAQEPVEEYTIALPSTDFEKVSRELQEYANSLETKIEDYRTIAKKAVNLL